MRVHATNMRSLRRNLPCILLATFLGIMMFMCGWLFGQGCSDKECASRRQNNGDKEIKEGYVKQLANLHELLLKSNNGGKIIGKNDIFHGINNGLKEMQKKFENNYVPQNNIYISNTKKPMKPEAARQKDKAPLDTKIQVGNLLEPVPDYIQIREADSPTVGDFVCGGSAVPNCCAFYVENIAQAKKICDSYRDQCEGFVLSSLSTSGVKVEYSVYLKSTVSAMTKNFLTDFFVKTKFIKNIGWRKTK